MEEVKNTISDAQKVAQKKYDKKTKMLSIKYTPSDMKDYERLKNYLDITRQSKNGFIKNLINNFFESGQSLKNIENKVKNPVEEKKDKEEYYYPYSWIDKESIQFLYDKLGQKAMENILDEFASIIEFELNNIIEDRGCGFDDWIREIEDRMDNDEFQDESKDAICKQLINEMCDMF